MTRTATETVVATVWCELLDLDDVDVTANFFEIGGHSLVAVQAVYRLSDRMGVPLELESFYDLGTVEEIAAQIDRLRAGGADAVPAFEEEL